MKFRKILLVSYYRSKSYLCLKLNTFDTISFKNNFATALDLQHNNSLLNKPNLNKKRNSSNNLVSISDRSKTSATDHENSQANEPMLYTEVDSVETSSKDKRQKPNYVYNYVFNYLSIYKTLAYDTDSR